jgi:hypothetical protein
MALHLDVTEESLKRLRVRAETITLWYQLVQPKESMRTHVCITQVAPEAFQDGSSRVHVQWLVIEGDIDIYSTSSATSYPDAAGSRGFDDAITIRQICPGWTADIKARSDGKLQVLGSQRQDKYS